MNLFNVLYQTYEQAQEAGLVDRTSDLNQEGRPPVLLPIFHSNRRASTAKDIIKVTLTQEGKFLSADFLPRNTMIIFPITEDSITRSNGIAPHALVDELSYLASDFNDKKHQAYLEGIRDWYYYSQDHTPPLLLSALYHYLMADTLLDDVLSSLYPGWQYRINKRTIELTKDDQTDKLTDKCFVTFQVERATEKDLTVSTDQALHQAYIDYVRFLMKSETQSYCNISGVSQYCSSKHRGIIGNAKLISVSNHSETYVGRFSDREMVTSIGYETSQKIHLMLKYLLENTRTRRSLRDNSTLVVWSSQALDAAPVDITQSQAFNSSSEESFNMFEHLAQDVPVTREFHLGDETSNLILNQLQSHWLQGPDASLQEHYYTLIINKVSNGRVAIKYFRDIYLSDLAQRLNDWYATTNWLMWTEKGPFILSPSFYQMALYTYGHYDDSSKKMVLKKDSLLNQLLEQLIPCIIDGKKLPLNVANQMLINITQRSSYRKNWNTFLFYACSILKKYKFDYKNERVSTALNLENQTRSYLYGRLAAVYEAIETSVGGRDRVTNVEKSWTRLMRYPEDTLTYLEGKIMPYKIRLKKEQKYYYYYQNILAEIMSTLGTLQTSNDGTNQAVDEDFIFGYYAQRQEIFKPRQEEAEDNNDPLN